MRWGSIAPERGSTNPPRPIERLPSKANASRETRDGANNDRVTCSVLINNQRRMATTFSAGSTIWAINAASFSNASRFSS
jgi:hypothetical protein